MENSFRHLQRPHLEAGKQQRQRQQQQIGAAAAARALAAANHANFTVGAPCLAEGLALFGEREPGPAEGHNHKPVALALEEWHHRLVASALDLQLSRRHRRLHPFRHRRQSQTTLFHVPLATCLTMKTPKLKLQPA